MGLFDPTPAAAAPQPVQGLFSALGPDDRSNQAFNRNRKYAKPGGFVTALPPDQERAFRQWVAANKVPFQPDDQASDYDMRGYWRDVASQGTSETAVNPNDHQVHYPDTYKTPYHQSFSAESMYALPTAPVWINDHQLADPQTGAVIFDECPKDAKHGRRSR